MRYFLCLKVQNCGFIVQKTVFYGTKPHVLLSKAIQKMPPNNPEKQL
jgi:hypothetical protein